MWNAERGRREFTSAELMALALVFEIPPGAFLVPDDPDAEVEFPSGEARRPETLMALQAGAEGELSIGRGLADLLEPAALNALGDIEQATRLLRQRIGWVLRAARPDEKSQEIQRRIEHNEANPSTEEQMLRQAFGSETDLERDAEGSEQR